MGFKKTERISFPKMEERVLEFWRDKKVFEKSVERRPKEKPFSFYDGPPYATGMPHYGNLLAGLIKDVIPRYKTMRGFRVERVWGWDTHGLPIENIVEKELGLKSKTEIKEYGIDKFNEKCRSKVFEYVKAWEKIVERTGRWADMENAYVTMDKDYMESIWWVFSELWKKDLVYEGYKVMPYCPRCATGQSSFEVGLGGYKEKTDRAVTVRLESQDRPGVYFLAWTTTPWTLPGNLALAVGEDVKYVRVEHKGKSYILAEERLVDYEAELRGFRKKDVFLGRDLVGEKYRPLFDYHDGEKAFEIISGDFVTTDEGTGLVHIAPAFGEEDYEVSRKFGIDFFMPVDEMGRLTAETDYGGLSVVEPETNEKIVGDLGERVVKVEDHPHQYPFCWRCRTPLIFKAIDSWFVAIEKLRSKMIKNNKKVFWVPGFVGQSRYQKLIEGAPDWNVSRNRYWGVPIPVWICGSCDEKIVFGSVGELEKASGRKIDDIHLHKIAGISVPCRCGKKAELSGEILDVWFDSGSMPYGKLHFPFENKERFEREFPADFIAEGIDQTRGWFNSLMVLGTALFDESPYKSVVVNGTVLAEDGQKMSKSLANFPDPSLLMDKHGADAMRFYLMGSPAVRAEDLRFSEKGVEEVVKKINLTLWNSYSFFMMYASLDGFEPKKKAVSDNPLDRWLVSKTNRLVLEVTDRMEEYDLSKAAEALSGFVDDLSNWYIRRSRKRFWKSEDDSDKEAAYETLYGALVVYVKLLAPFMPFLTEELYSGLVRSIDDGAPESVHLSDWPKADEKSIDDEVTRHMDYARLSVELGLAERNKAGIKVRQPLGKLTVSGPVEKLPEEYRGVIKEEVNVKRVEFKKKASGSEAKLDTKITKELKMEGLARDFVRFIQDGRKKAGFSVEDRIKTNWQTDDEEIKKALRNQENYIARETLSVEFEEKEAKGEYEETVKLDGREVSFGIGRKR